MSEPTNLFLALGAGGVLGALFFGGLWWTVRAAPTSRWPAALFLGSLLLRTLIVLAGFFAVARGDWKRLLACLVGFFVARIIATVIAAPTVGKEPRLADRGET